MNEAPKKRLRKNCPCHKCSKWRHDRRMTKAAKEIQKALEVGAKQQPLMFGGPLIIEELFGLKKEPVQQAETPLLIGRAK